MTSFLGKAFWVALHRDERGFLAAIGTLLSGGISRGLQAAFQPGGIFGGGGFTPTGSSITPTAAQLPAPIPPQTITLPGGAGTVSWPRWLLTAVRVYGPEVGQAIFRAYQQRVRAGQSTSSARAAVLAAYPGIRISRRMNPTNVRALRRAIRRVRSFQRATGKVNRLLPRRGGGARVVHVPSGYRHRRRRGDLDPFYAEDLADYYDTAEDLGYDPAPFREDGD